MTPEEHRKQLRTLKACKTRKRKAMKVAPTLAAKLAIDREIKQIEVKIRQHTLNYFELVSF